MNLPAEIFPFIFLTPCFSGGAEGRQATGSELRVPPMRGQIRFWHRAAFGLSATDRIWGSVTAGASSSRVTLRLLAPLASENNRAPVLPHKTTGDGPRAALPSDKPGSFCIHRLPWCGDDDWRQAIEATMLWLLAGTLGFRSARAAGSIWPTAGWTPRKRDELAALLAPLQTTGWQAALAGLGNAKSAIELRQTASDTLGGNPTLFGSANPRKPSPVRFKVVRLGSATALLAVAPPAASLKLAETNLNGKPDPSRWNALGAWDHLF